MVALTEKEQQVLNIIGSLPPDRRRLLLYAIAQDSEVAWQRNAAYAESQLRQLASSRGLDWNQLDDEQRQDFVRELLRESD